MDILVTIISYGTNQWELLERVLSEYHKMQHNVDVVLDLTENREEGWPDPVMKTRQFDTDLGHRINFQHRSYMADREGEYDLYIFSEDDILITENNINAYVSESNRIPADEITGFIRFERSNSDNHYHLIDCHPQRRPMHPVDKHGRYRIIQQPEKTIQEKEYFQLLNLHQGCWILTDDQFSRATDHEAYHRDPGKLRYRPHRTPGSTKDHPAWWRMAQTYGPLEAACTDIYTDCGFNHKVLPRENIGDFLVHHLSDVYVESGEFEQPYPLTLNQLEYVLDVDKPLIERLTYKYSR